MATGDRSDQAFDPADAQRDPARRNFISTVGMLGTGAAFGAHERAAVGGKQTDRTAGDIPLRPLGRTGIRASILGVGVNEATLHKILVENPRRALAFVAKAT